jgi:hypothetical protein
LSIRLRKIIVEHVVTTGPGCAVRRAAELMNEHARGGIKLYPNNKTNFAEKL